MTAAKGQRADARRNRDAIVARARELFGAGDQALRFDDFAAEAGVGVGTLYRNYSTRQALAAAVYDEEVTSLVALAETLRAELPPPQALAAFLRGMVARIDDGRDLARRLAELLVTVPEQMVESGLRLERAVGELHEAAVASGAIRADVSPGAVMMALHGIGAAQDRPHWRAEAEEVVTLLLSGLRP